MSFQRKEKNPQCEEYLKWMLVNHHALSQAYEKRDEFLLKAYDAGATCREIAELLGISPASAHSMMVRARVSGDPDYYASG